MRTLHYVGPGPDSDHVLVEPVDGGEQFSLFLDVPLRDAARADLHHVPAHDHPAVTPREIQTRVRAGESPQQIAERYGVTLESVLKFAGNVLEERSRVAMVARESKARRTDPAGRTVIFGVCVDATFTTNDIDPATVLWDSRRREDGQWVVTATWRDDETPRLAEWLFQLGHRSVTPIDDLGADLLSDRTIRVPVVADFEVTGDRPLLSIAPDPVDGVVPFPPMPGADTGPLPVIDDVFDQEAPEPAPELPLGLPEFVTTPAPEPVRPVAARPDGSLNRTARPTRPGGRGRPNGAHKRTPIAGLPARAGETEEEKAERARIPSWDDILLGVRRKQD